MTLTIKITFTFTLIALMLSCSVMTVSAESNSNYAEEILQLVNIERQSRGIAPLRLNRNLNQGAAIRAMEITHCFSHTRPNGNKFYTVFKNPNAIYMLGENIAAGHASPEQTVKQWMNSSGHRENILRKDYTELGVGYAFSKDSEFGHYWVQIFSRPMNSAHR